MYKLAAFSIFATAFLITANMQGYIHSLRIGIYAWQIYFSVIPVQFALILALGSWRTLQPTTLTYIFWWCSLIFTVGISLVFVKADAGAVTVASQMVTIGIISSSFLILTQHTAVAKAGFYGIAAAVIVASGVSLAEFMDPSFNAILDQRYQKRTLEDEIQRVGGLYVNANLNACVMVLGMFATVFAIPARYRLLFCLFVGAGIFTTVSRSGMTSWVLAMTMLFMLGQFSTRYVISKIVALGVALTLVVVIFTGAVPEFLIFTGLDQLMTEQMVSRVSSNFFSQVDGSTTGRKYLALEAIELYSQHAILGVGLGGASELGETALAAHNTVLDIAAELGTVGVLVYLSVIFIVFYTKSIKAAAFLILYFFLNMFIHGLMSKPALAFILPAGVILLSRLDLKRMALSERVRKKRKNRSRYVRNIKKIRTT